MQSSGSTRKPRRSSSLRLLIVLAGEDRPKACTGRRLIRWGRATEVSRADANSSPSIVLDPYAPTPLSEVDLETAERGGLLVVDCSWNRLASRGAFPGADTRERSRERHRRLPMLVATNPQHYGRLAQLNTVEALCAALYVLGRSKEAEELITGFAGGAEFLEVNRDRLEQYRQAAVPLGIAAAEKRLFGPT